MFRKLVLVIGAIVATYISFRALTAPESVLSNFGLMVEGVDGRNEVRGQYGGFFGAVALTMVLSLMGRLSERFGLLVLLITVGGVLAGRLASVALEGPSVIAAYSSGIKTFIIVDIVIVALTLIALRRTDAEMKG